jgi:hypothetical protein
MLRGSHRERSQSAQNFSPSALVLLQWRSASRLPSGDLEDVQSAISNSAVSADTKMKYLMLLD